MFGDQGTYVVQFWLIIISDNDFALAVITFFIQSITRISTRMFADLTARYENLGLGGMIDLCTKDEIAEIFDIVSIKKLDFPFKI